MFLRDLAYTGFGVVEAARTAAVERFNSLSQLGETARHEEGTLASTIDRVVTRDVPWAIGYALGSAVDSTVRGLELAREAACEVPRVAENALMAVLYFAGVPSARDLAELRQRLDVLSQQIERLLQPGAVETPPWEEPDEPAVTAPLES